MVSSETHEWDITPKDVEDSMSVIAQVAHITPKHCLMYSRWWQVYWNLDQYSTIKAPVIHRVELISINMSLVHRKMYPRLLKAFRELPPMKRSLVQQTLRRHCEMFTEANVWATFNWMRYDMPHLIIHYSQKSHRIPSEQELVNIAHRLRNIYEEFLNQLKIVCEQEPSEH